MGPLLRTVKWLGEEDSNPRSVVQSHVSYRWTIPQPARAFYVGVVEAVKTTDPGRS